MATFNNIDISAELQLEYLHPGDWNRWFVQNKGTFYRNYKGDLMDLDEEQSIASLSRDGFIHLLPQGMLTTDQELSNLDRAQQKEKWQQLQARKKRLDAAFQPIDSVRFRQRLKIEHELSDLLLNKTAIILKQIYGIDVKELPNPIVKEIAMVMPLIRRYRGDMQMIRNFISKALNSKVEARQKRYSDTDTTRQWIAECIFDIYIDGMSTVTFGEMQTSVKALEAFLTEWMVPVEVKVRLNIRSSESNNKLGEELILDYNVQI